jgi:hypothetical protein
MGSQLINVRLDEERLRKARQLREHGVTLSDVVREAIDERFAALRRDGASRDVRRLIRDLFEQYPDDPGTAPRDYDVHDPAAARAALGRRLRRPRS